MTCVPTPPRSRDDLDEYPTARFPAIGPLSGFSLIELILAVAVVGLLLSFAVPRSSAQLGRTRVGRAAAVVASDLQYAQMQAVRRRTPILVLVNPAVRGYIIRDRDSSVVHRERLFGMGTDFNLEQFLVAPGNVEFFPNGVTRGAATFTLGIGDVVRHVRLSRAGQIRVDHGP